MILPHPKVFPTHVGMFRGFTTLTSNAQSFPHSRGDVPALNPVDEQKAWFSPLTWGCSCHKERPNEDKPVFPTHVGMFLSPSTERLRRGRFPHSRGDVPNSDAQGLKRRWFSPLTWGCSEEGLSPSPADIVFPTHVGMFRFRESNMMRHKSFPHSRGDVPRPDYARPATLPFSPLTWGCSGRWRMAHHLARVFPTHVGMFRSSTPSRALSIRFPHSRGDVPF